MNIETAQFGAERHADCGGKLTQEIAETSRSSGGICNQMCLKYLKDTRVTVRHGINEGLSAARNIGLDIAKGTFVLFVDSDDYIEPDMIENFYMCQKKQEQIQ